MEHSGALHEIQEKINNARSDLDQPVLLPVDNVDEFVTVGNTEISFEVEKEESPNAAIDKIKGEVDSLFLSTDLDPEQMRKKELLLDKYCTHIDLHHTIQEEKVSVVAVLYQRHLQLDPVGPFIEGDLVVQGTSCTEGLGPAFCIVDCATELGQPFAEVMKIGPWKMIMSGGNDGDGTKFMIPIGLGDGGAAYAGQIVRVRIFVDEADRIPYDEEPAVGYAMDETAGRCAVSFESWIDSNADSVGGGGEGLTAQERQAMDSVDADMAALFSDAKDDDGEGVPPGSGRFVRPMDATEDLLGAGSFGVLKDIKIAFDYDDVVSLQSEGFELLCMQITPDGLRSDQEHLWKFHVLGSYGDARDGGVEDIAWIKCLKSLGTLPALPFFEILHDYDLSEPDDDYSIYIAVKMGLNPRFKRMIMLSSLIEHEEQFTKFVGVVSGAFRPAPTEISKAFGGPCGILLTTDSVLKSATVTVEAVAISAASPQQNGRASGEYTATQGGGGDDLSRMTPVSAGAEGRSEGDADDSDDDDDFEDEDDLVAGLMQQLSELESEKQSLSSLNLELQKKAVALMVREKAMQGQARAATESGVAAVEQQQQEANNEQNQEKDKQYQDTLHLIVDDRVKLNEQLREFDQLALDLQTRLDDKELKFNGIDLSFKKFKKEILSKAENSRTGHTISKKQIKQFETAEQKREEDLEKVRLRNISLRTTYRKLERTLRAREQLAEGLHMIDFEQLKIENQTLNEKIEERNEELAKLKRKKTTTVQVLTHVREKLRFVEQANKVVQFELSTLEASTTSLRNIVTSEKLQRDAIRVENNELKAKQGFASSDLLLSDYEKRRGRVEQLRASIAELKDRYGILMRQVNVAISKSNSTTPWNLMSSTSNKL